MEKRTLREFLEEWLISVRNSAKPNTYAAYFAHANNHIFKHELASAQLNQIQSSDIQSFVQGLEGVNGNKLSGKTVRLIYEMFKTALNCAVDYGWIERNPCQRIRLPRSTPREIRVISIKEQEKLEKAIKTSHNNKAFGVLIGLYTGLRLGEICALKWSDIDFENRELSVKRSISRVPLHLDAIKQKTAIVEDTPKTRKSCRVIHLPDFLVRELKAKYSKRRSQYVISMCDGKCVQPRTMQDVFKSLIKECGMEQTNFHALRHTFATRAIELNVNICAVSEILGHSNVSMTVNTQ